MRVIGELTEILFCFFYWAKSSVDWARIADAVDKAQHWIQDHLLSYVTYSVSLKYVYRSVK